MRREEKKRNGISMMVGCFAMAGSSQTNRRGAKMSIGVSRLRSNEIEFQMIWSKNMYSRKRKQCFEI